MPTTTARRTQGTADAVQDSTALRGAARVGFAAAGLVHILIGVVALRVAFGGSGEADQGGALEELAKAPGGEAMLWVVAVAVWCLALFLVISAIVLRGTDSKKVWARRAKYVGTAVAYVAVGFTAFEVAIGSGADSSKQTETWSARLLAATGGRTLLVIVGLAVVAVGVYFVVKGVRQKFREDITLPSSPAVDKAVVVTATTGYVAKGVAIVIVGVLFVVAALTRDADKASGLDGALKALTDLPFGVVLLVVVAIGLITYGVYFFFRARYARLGAR
ncbi:DUF1206 domain-containing protein [Luteimicrobium subarcticum]|uniref:Uncharacterized protein DUF1206 n=1 Tax=Luteimicrobium subarcticum TaxID=620910 RepID=A0A2M8W740_9MICO|nr:DUF1206 domain-containing protein [Luteimicrobium subarcticum]PJI86704.1 uncharacterized protein DUF1206 [Luteimicrobium subarcticum]